MKIASWKESLKGARLGFFDLQLDNGWIINGCSVFQKDDKRWWNFPQRRYEHNGETKWANYIKIPDETEYWGVQDEVKDLLVPYIDKTASPAKDDDIPF